MSKQPIRIWLRICEVVNVIFHYSKYCFFFFQGTYCCIENKYIIKEEFLFVVNDTDLVWLKNLLNN